MAPDLDGLRDDLNRLNRPPEELTGAELDDVTVDDVLDVQGEVCPHPVDLALRKLITMQPGQVLKEITDHTMSTHNVPKAVKEKGLGEVLGIREADAGVYEIFIRR